MQFAIATGQRVFEGGVRRVVLVLLPVMVGENNRNYVVPSDEIVVADRSPGGPESSAKQLGSTIPGILT